MKRKVVDWTIDQVYKKREQITFPDFQREPNLWSLKDKQLLIDSILHDFDIPKLYFYDAGKNSYEVVDGQQRLWAIWEYLDNNYSCSIDKENKKFSELSPNYKKAILEYHLHITFITSVSEEIGRASCRERV